METQDDEVLSALKAMGMQGDDPEAFLVTAGVEGAVEFADKVCAESGDQKARKMLLAYLAHLYLCGRQSGYERMCKELSGEGEQGILLGTGHGLMEPSEKVVVVGITVGSIPRLLFGEPLKKMLGPDGVRIWVSIAPDLSTIRQELGCVAMVNHFNGLVN